MASDKKISPIKAIQALYDTTIGRWVAGVVYTLFVGFGGYLFGAWKDFSSLDTRVDATEQQLNDLKNLPELVHQLGDKFEVLDSKIDILIEVLNN